MKTKSGTSAKAELRKRAEEKLNERKSTEHADKEQTRSFSESRQDTDSLIHDLEVHQIELEMQNEELVQSRTQVQELLNRYTELYDFAPVGYFTLKRDGTIVQANITVENMLGAKHNTLINQHFKEFVSVEFQASLNAFLEKVFGSQRAETCEVQLLGNGHDPRWVYIEAISRKGHPETNHVIVSDITERKLSTKALIRSENELKKTQEIAHIGNWRLDFATNQVVWSEELYKMYGFDPALPPPLLNESNTLFTPESWELLSTSIAKTGETGIPYEIELKLIRKDGSNGWMWARGEAITDNAGKIIGIWGAVQDISERKHAEEAFFKTTEQLEHIGKMARIGGWELDLATTQVAYSKETAHIHEVDFPYVPHKLSQGNEFYPPEVWPDVQATVQAAIEHGTAYDREWPFITAKGNRIWVRVQGFCVKENGKTIKLQGTFQDISERKNIEQKLVENEKRLRDIIFSVGDWVWEMDKNGVYTNSSISGVDILGRSMDEIIGKTPFDFMLPEEAKRVGQIFSEIIAKKGYIKDLENWYVKKNGETICLLTNGLPILDKEGNLQGYRGVDKDITQHKCSVEKIHELTQAVEQSPVSIVITDTKGTIEYVNNKFIELTGYTFEEAIGKNPRILKSGETTDEEYKKLWETIAAGKEWFGEFHNKKKNGELFWESAAISSIVNEKGKTTHFLAIKEDITSLKKSQAQMLRSQRMESIGTLAGGIAHDLNNILGPILLSAQILRMKVHDKELQSLITTIEASTNRGKNIIAQVLGFARGVENKFILMQIRHIVKEVEDVIKQTFEKNIVIQSYAPKDLWTINADPTQLHQVLMNLCVNARDAMPNGGNLNINVKNVAVDDSFRSHHSLATKEQYLEIEVRDTGSGIPLNIQQKIFDPFFTTKDVGKGTGLGLSTVYSIVEAHFGFIEMESIVGKGTVFQIYIPAAIESEKGVELTPTVNIQQGNNESILVIDDEEPVRSTCEEALKFYNYSVVTAENGAEGIIKLIQKGMKFTVVLVDMMMPVMDGKTASAAIRKIEPNIKIIGMSGMMDQSKTISEDKVFDLFLRKPFSTKELIEAVQKVIAEDTPVIK